MTNAAPTLVLVRHAQSIWSAQGRFQGTSDPPLSDLGRAQIEAVGAALGTPAARQSLGLPDEAPLAIVHSPLERATLTAQAIAKWYEAVPISIDEDLREVGQGAWEGLTHEEVVSRWPDEYDAWRRSPGLNSAPGGERLSDANARARRALDHLVGIAETGPSNRAPWVVAVAHDGILRLILLSALELDLDRYWSFPFIQCGITVLGRQRGFELRVHNASSHLPGLS